MKKYIRNEDFSQCCPGWSGCCGHEVEVEMPREEALKRLWSRARDFQNWVGGEISTPSTKSVSEGIDLGPYMEEMAAFVRDRFPAVARGDQGWNDPAYFKREELDEAFQVLGLDPLQPGNQMDKEEFIKSEPAVIIAKNGVDSPSLPAWITEEQKEQFRSLAKEDVRSILREDEASRDEYARLMEDMYISNQEEEQNLLSPREQK